MGKQISAIKKEILQNLKKKRRELRGLEKRKEGVEKLLEEALTFLVSKARENQVKILFRQARAFGDPEDLRNPITVSGEALSITPVRIHYATTTGPGGGRSFNEASSEHPSKLLEYYQPLQFLEEIVKGESEIKISRIQNLK